MEQTNNGGIPEMEVPPTQPGKFSQENIRKLADEGKGKLGKLLNKRTLTLVLVVLVLVIGGIVGIGYATNNYKTPILEMQKLVNQKSPSGTKLIQNAFRDTGASNSGELIKCAAKSDALVEVIEDLDENLVEIVEDRMDSYGGDFKVTYKVLDKSELKKSELRDYKKGIREKFSRLEELAQASKDYDSDDWEELADRLEITKGQAKSLMDAVKEMCDDVKHVEVSQGYELELSETITGSELDEPEEESSTMVVLKINGKWVNVFMIDIASTFAYAIWDAAAY